MAQMVRTSPFSFWAAAASAQGVDGAGAGFSADVLPRAAAAAVPSGGDLLGNNGRPKKREKNPPAGKKNLLRKGIGTRSPEKGPPEKKLPEKRSSEPDDPT